jgi:hypothetical protein
MIIKILLTLVISILSGILGRLGGAQGYDTLYRDIGCSILSLTTFWIWFGFRVDYWWIYLLVFAIQWATFSTYYEPIFHYHNFWFGGLIAGIALLPLLFVYNILPFYLIRTLSLVILWGCLNKFLPNPVFCWDRAIGEEFLRYFSVTITYLLRICPL